MWTKPVPRLTGALGAPSPDSSSNCTFLSASSSSSSSSASRSFFNCSAEMKPVPALFFSFGLPSSWLSSLKCTFFSSSSSSSSSSSPASSRSFLSMFASIYPVPCFLTFGTPWPGAASKPTFLPGVWTTSLVAEATESTPSSSSSSTSSPASSSRCINLDLSMKPVPRFRIFGFSSPAESVLPVAANVTLFRRLPPSTGYGEPSLMLARLKRALSPSKRVKLSLSKLTK
mmetsp:Transcript_94875/g.164674  ORF Transcript_94875/g.164674 Transcript_94875/m.164674 type:complete len:229 (+) Transcript_94875:178-864(+)